MTDPPTTDADIIEASVAKPDAFARLYDRYAADIHRYALRRLGDTYADDVTADTFLTAFRKRSKFDARGSSARPWLYGIAANLIGKHRRTEERALRAFARTGSDPVARSWAQDPDWAERVESRVTAQAAQAPLAAALAALSNGDRHVLLLVAWADLTYQEVAEALGIPVGTVRSRLNRARRKVRAELGENPMLVRETAEVV